MSTIDDLIVTDNVGDYGEQIWSLENIDLKHLPESGSFRNHINSPRSLEAFKRSGIEPRELDPITQSSIVEMLKSREQGKRVPKEIVKLRMENMDRRRYNKLSVLRDVRERIIEEQYNAMKSENQSMLMPTRTTDRGANLTQPSTSQVRDGMGSNGDPVTVRNDEIKLASQSIQSDQDNSFITATPQGVGKRMMNNTTAGFYNADSSREVGGEPNMSMTLRPISRNHFRT